MGCDLCSRTGSASPTTTRSWPQQRVSQLLARAHREMPAADLEAIRAEELDLIDAAIRSLLRLTRNERRPGM